MNMAAMQMAFITTVLHEVGHAYDLYVRDSAASPSVSSAAGREDVVLERGLDAWAIKNADGLPKQLSLGEAGDLVEQRLSGNTYTLSALSQRLADNPWLSFPGVEVQEINQVNYAFSKAQTFPSSTSVISCCRSYCRWTVVARLCSASPHRTIS